MEEIIEFTDKPVVIDFSDDKVIIDFFKKLCTSCDEEYVCPDPQEAGDKVECEIFFESWETQFDFDLAIDDVMITEEQGGTLQAEIIPSGGDEPYLYKIDGGDWQESPIFTGLTPEETYTFTVQDSFFGTASQEVLMFTPVYEEFEATGAGAEGDIQQFEIPITGNYRLTALGAQGGKGGSAGIGGLGAKMSGVFEFEQGDLIDILVGQQGQSDGGFLVSGGGASVVAKPAAGEAEISTVDDFDELADSFETDTNNLSFIVNQSDFVENGASGEFTSNGTSNAGEAFVEKEIDFTDLDVFLFYYKGARINNSWFTPRLFIDGTEVWNLTPGTTDTDYPWTLEVLNVSALTGILTVRFLVWCGTTGVANRHFYFDEVAVPAPKLYLIAGGGGGYGVGTTTNQQEVAHAHTLPNGKDAFGGAQAGSGGIDGTGGGSGDRAEGGAGFLGDGSGTALAYINGGLGGINSSYPDGGFGGGGEVVDTTGWGTLGGGGGYSGGGGAYAGSTNAEGAGGGGGSLNNGTDQDNEDAFNEGHGKIIIERLAPVA